MVSCRGDRAYRWPMDSRLLFLPHFGSHCFCRALAHYVPPIRLFTVHSESNTHTLTHTHLGAGRDRALYRLVAMFLRPCFMTSELGAWLHSSGTPWPGVEEWGSYRILSTIEKFAYVLMRRRRRRNSLPHLLMSSSFVLAVP